MYQLTNMPAIQQSGYGSIANLVHAAVSVQLFKCFIPFTLTTL